MVSPHKSSYTESGQLLTCLGVNSPIKGEGSLTDTTDCVKQPGLLHSVNSEPSVGIEKDLNTTGSKARHSASHYIAETNMCCDREGNEQEIKVILEDIGSLNKNAYRLLMSKVDFELTCNFDKRN